jgi:hypothetical protein
MKLQGSFQTLIRKYPVNTNPQSDIFTKIMGPADIINCEMCKADTAIFPSCCGPKIERKSVLVTQVNMRESSVQNTKSILFTFCQCYGGSRFLHNIA